MRNVWLVARREYRERIRTRGFIITTIMIPVIMGGFIFGSIYLGSKTAGDQHIAVVSTDTHLALDLQTELQRQQQQLKSDTEANSEGNSSSTASHKKTSSIIVEAIEPGPNTRAELNQDLDSNDLDGYLWITPVDCARWAAQI